MDIKVDTKVTIDKLEYLEKYINYVNGMIKMQTDKAFQKYIKQRCFDVLEMVMNERLFTADTTNNHDIGIYMNSNHIIDTENGFIIYNDAKVPADVSGLQNDISNYEDGMINLALAFEYGVGLVGPATNNPKAWEYNVNHYNFGWILPRNIANAYGVPYGQEFAGYQGLNIYYETAITIETNLKDWVLEYMRGVK